MTSLSCKAIALCGFHIPTVGEDYLAIKGLVLEFEAEGKRSHMVPVGIVDDLLFEGPENFFGTLSVVSGEGLIQFSQSTAEFIIIDNDSEYCHINWTRINIPVLRIDNSLTLSPMDMNLIGIQTTVLIDDGGILYYGTGHPVRMFTFMRVVIKLMSYN